MREHSRRRHRQQRRRPAPRRRTASPAVPPQPPIEGKLEATETGADTAEVSGSVASVGTLEARELVRVERVEVVREVIVEPPPRISENLMAEVLLDYRDHLPEEMKERFLDTLGPKQAKAIFKKDPRTCRADWSDKAWNGKRGRMFGRATGKIRARLKSGQQS